MKLRGMARLAGSFSLVAALTAVALPVAATTASASARGCVKSFEYISSCIQIEGEGTYVKWIRPGALLQGGIGKAEISFQVDDSAGKVYVATKYYKAPNYFVPTHMWGDKIQINRHLPHNDKVCVRVLWDRLMSPACKTILK